MRLVYDLCFETRVYLFIRSSNIVQIEMILFRSNRKRTDQRKHMNRNKIKLDQRKHMMNRNKIKLSSYAFNFYFARHF